MKQDLFILGGIIALCITAIVVSHVSFGYVSEKTCMVETAFTAVHDGIVRVTMTVKPLGEIVMLSESDDSHERWINPSDYTVGSMFKCIIHTFRPIAFQTVSRFDGFMNKSENTYNRENAYNASVIWFTVAFALVALIDLSILIQVARGTRTFDLFSILYSKLDDAHPPVAQMTAI